MTVAEAKRTAIAWTHEYLASVPNVVGALLAGSINQRAEDAPFSAASDVDIYVYQGPEGTPRPPKIPHAGLILEPSHHGAAILGDLERLLGDPHQAPHVAAGHIIADPQGALRRAHEAVRDGFPRLRWVRRRMEWAVRNATGKLESCVNARDPHVGLVCAYSLGLRNIAAIAPIAVLQNPTLRRCLVVSRDILVAGGHGELHEELLDILGSRETSAATAREFLEPTMTLFRRAAAVARTPFWAKFELDPLAETLFREGLVEMIDAGDHREAMLYLLFIHYFCGHALTNDGSDADRRDFEVAMERARPAFIARTLTEIQERSRRALALLPRVHAACDEIARNCPAVRADES